MNKLLFISILAISSLIISCNGGSGGGGGSAAPDGPALAQSTDDQVYGDWQYLYPGGTANKAKVLVGKLSKDGSIKFTTAYGVGDANNISMAFRTNIGTFTRSGDNFNVTYSYETCAPVGSEIIKIKIDPSNSNRLFVANSDGSVFITMQRMTQSTSNAIVTAVEDKNCNLFTKLMKNEKRMPASAKSFFEVFRGIKD